MVPSRFKVVEHTIPSQSIREYHHAVKPASPALQLAIKQYIPLDNLTPGSDDLTVIAGHANGIPKECYEPLWEELLSSLAYVKIKAIWIADCVHQGVSGVLNEHSLGNDPNWFDHSRDLLFMVNHFRELIQPPIVGIAHSFSCSQFVHLSIMHPRLLHSLVLLEPMIQVESPSKPGGPNPARWTSSRPDVWPSREDAERYIRESSFWRRWDPRSTDQYIQYGLRPAPTVLYPNSDPGAMTLVTTKAQEAWTYLRLNAVPQHNDGGGTTERFLAVDLAKVPREGDNNNSNYLFVCPWSCIAFEYLPYLRPSVMFIFGEKSHINVPERRGDKLERTGTGIGGSGGIAAGCVKAYILPGTSHMAPLEKVHDTAQAISAWLGSQVGAYQSEKAFWDNYDSKKSESNEMALSSEWMDKVKQPVDINRESKSRL
ncbi:hypothetical protein BDV06DRAFT_232381 [Aspergillus oleicola]